MKKAQIRIYESSPGQYIEPNLFSHNLEHTRATIYKGLSAQMLRNRKFAGKPHCYTGVAYDWYRIGAPEVFLTLNRFDSYVRHAQEWNFRSGIEGRRNELNSQIIQNPVEGSLAGIGQDGLYLKEKLEYEIRAVLKGRGEKDITCRVQMVNLQHNQVYAWREYELSQNEWRKIQFTFAAPADDTNACLEIIFKDRGELKVGVVSLLPCDHILGMRRDVIDDLRKIGPAVLRWPGGNFAGEYRWKDGLLDVDERGALKSVREMETHPHTHGFDFHELAVDDFIQLCRMVDAEPYITLNLQWDSPQDCADFVEYCNGGQHTQWGGTRARRGHPEPYHVRMWALGNEFGLGHMEGPNTPELYNEYALRTMEKMKAVDPDLIFFSSGAYTPEMPQEMDLWLENSLPVLAQAGVRYISYHHYQRQFEGTVDFVTDQGLEESYNSIVDTYMDCLEKLRQLRAAMDQGPQTVQDVCISFDEWNMYFAWYHEPCVMEGMYTALMLEMFCKHCKELNMPMVMYFQPVSEGAILVRSYDSELSANGQVFALMKAHKGRYLLQADTDDTELHCLASLDQESGRTTLTLINRSYDNPVEVCLALEGKKVMDATLLVGRSLYHGSKFEEAQPPITDENFCIPAHSILQAQLDPA